MHETQGPGIELNNNLYTQFARARAFLPKEFLGFLMILQFLLEELLVWTTRPIELWLRVRFGCRGHSAFQANQIFFWGAVIGCITVKSDPLLSFFCLFTAGKSLYNLWEARRQDSIGPPIRYSWSSGEPVDFWQGLVRILALCRIKADRFLTIENITRFGEPAAVFFIQLAVAPFSRSLSLYLLCCSVALLIKGMIVHERLRTMRLDQQDARILSQWLARQSRNAVGAGDQTAYVVQLAVTHSAQSAPEPVIPPDEAGHEEQPAPQPEPEASNRLSIVCDNCGRKLRVSMKHLGKTGKCKCGHNVPVTADAAL